MRRVRRWGPVPVVLCVALFGLACADEEIIPAATVNGTEITQQQVVDYLEAIEANDDYVAAIEGSGASISGSSPGSFDLAFAANVLTLQIHDVLVRQELERRHIEITEECRKAGEEDLIGLTGGGDPERGEELFSGFPAEFRRQRAQASAEALALQADLIGFECRAEDAAERYFADHSAEFMLTCVQLIVVATPEDAEDVTDDLADGVDFTALAAERSIDPSGPTGGSVGCLSESQLNERLPDLAAALGAAEPNQVVGPVPTAAGVTLARVTERRAAADLVEVRSEVEGRLAGAADAAFQEWLGATVAEAEIEIDARYGRWDPASARIIAPEVPPTTAVTDLPAETSPPASG